MHNAPILCADDFFFSLIVTMEMQQNIFSSATQSASSAKIKKGYHKDNLTKYNDRALAAYFNGCRNPDNPVWIYNRYAVMRMR
jgi:hypothetical protein